MLYTNIRTVRTYHYIFVGYFLPYKNNERDFQRILKLLQKLSLFIKLSKVQKDMGSTYINFEVKVQED
jgi:hypothetical protein